MKVRPITLWHRRLACDLHTAETAVPHQVWDVP